MCRLIVQCKESRLMYKLFRKDVIGLIAVVIKYKQVGIKAKIIEIIVEMIIHIIMYGLKPLGIE